MRKKVLSLFLALVMVMAMFPVSALAANADGFEIDSNGVLTQYTGSGGAVTIPNSVTSIGEQAFRGCTELTSVTISDSVTSIGKYAFFNCTGLTSVVIPDSVTSIENEVFYGCTGLTSMTIPDGVDGIKWGTFAECTNLTSVSIPDSVTDIENNAFSDCTGLNDVYYAGTEEQWSIVYVYDGNEPLLNAKIHFNSTTPEQPEQPEQPAVPAQKTAMPTNDKLSVNGQQTEQAKVYKIGSSNYVKLRDVAALLNGTSAQFNVGYDDATKTVILTTGQGYKAKKSDLKGAAKSNKQVVAGRDTILIDGVEKELKAYKIGGNNYFKLRDLGKALGFKVGYQNGVATITTD